MFQPVSTISTFLEWFAAFWCFWRDVSSSGYCLDQFKSIAYPQIWKFWSHFSQLATTHPRCQRWWCWRWLWLCLHQLALREFCSDITGSNWSGPKSTKWMMGNCTTPLHPKKKGGTHESPMITRHISIRLSSDTKIPKNISVPEGWSWGWRFGVYQ